MCRRALNDLDQLEKDKKGLSICKRDRRVTRTHLDDALTVYAEAKPSKLIDKKSLAKDLGLKHQFMWKVY